MNYLYEHKSNPIWNAYQKDKALKTSVWHLHPSWEAYVAFQLALFIELAKL